MKIDVCFSPHEYQNDLYKDYTVVVIDVLRATTCIATAFANGCRTILPVETIEEAFNKKEQQYPEALLAGERQGLLIPGFNMGNSPSEYKRELINGKTIIMTTTNGTIALKRAGEAGQIYTAAFVNAMAVCLKLKERLRNTVILCAGTEGRFSFEDALCAGLLSDRLSDIAVLADKALAVQAMYRGVRANLTNKVMASTHARYLTQIGFSEDIDMCLEHDLYAVTPIFENSMIRT